MVPIINDLLSSNRLQLLMQDGVVVYKLIHEEKAAKFEGLGPEQILVYQAIEKAGNKGAWTRDIKTSTNIPQQMLTKTLKALEQRNLIKTVRSVSSKSKKLYMLADLVPAKEITGGPWYTDQEFDSEFIEELCKFIVQFVRAQGIVGLGSIGERVRISGISKVELSLDELELVLQTLVYDGHLEEVQTAVVMLTGQASGQAMYKVSRSVNPPNYFTEFPCGSCPVIERCCDGGIISPRTCEYMKHWLEMPDVEDIA
eukprot:CAMPEP_0182433336 /NCGR_PEP_ID=MMETSP1167-20130531/62560_1 /TAXON_ID=2988 /ORGANISM="Mallomonas Sp, Strain CCMP3275" /LENGTH=255 /DNA_ID=CAMNT_0024621907 /DNA_START=178 /DNA_END=945 /DNA_ORIENTATION=+